jgi:hypothetical protein
MDEIAVTFFLAGTQPTLPVYVWGLLRFGFTPEVNAVFTLIAGGSLTLLAVAAGLLALSARRHRIVPAEQPQRSRRLKSPFGQSAVPAGAATQE